MVISHQVNAEEMLELLYKNSELSLNIFFNSVLYSVNGQMYRVNKDITYEQVFKEINEGLEIPITYAQFNHNRIERAAVIYTPALLKAYIEDSEFLTLEETTVEDFSLEYTIKNSNDIIEDGVFKANVNLLNGPEIILRRVFN